MTLRRSLLAEALGTALLFATVIGSGIMAERLAGGNVAVALLGNTIAIAAMLAMLIAALGPVSGAHFNPLVTLALWRADGLPPRQVALYVAAQLAGGIAGALVTHAMFELPLVTPGTHVRTGTGQWLSEAVASFTLLLAIFGCRRARPDLVWAIVPLTVAGGIWFTASTFFANPAITIVRALTDSFTAIRPADVPPFIAAQLAGGVVALWLARGLGILSPSQD